MMSSGSPMKTSRVGGEGSVVSKSGRKLSQLEYLQQKSEMYTRKIEIEKRRAEDLDKKLKVRVTGLLFALYALGGLLCRRSAWRLHVHASGSRTTSSCHSISAHALKSIDLADLICQERGCSKGHGPAGQSGGDSRSHQASWNSRKSAEQIIGPSKPSSMSMIRLFVALCSCCGRRWPPTPIFATTSRTSVARS